MTTEEQMVLEAVCQEPVCAVVALVTGLPPEEVRLAVAGIAEGLPVGLKEERDG